jgi:hypothetical protein
MVEHTREHAFSSHIGSNRRFSGAGHVHREKTDAVANQGCVRLSAIIPKRRTADDIAWSNSGKDARLLK